jgi:hypothetical protein
LANGKCRQAWSVTGAAVTAHCRRCRPDQVRVRGVSILTEIATFIKSVFGNNYVNHHEKYLYFSLLNHESKATFIQAVQAYRDVRS